VQLIAEAAFAFLTKPESQVVRFITARNKQKVGPQMALSFGIRQHPTKLENPCP
jgi:hypothetical protein